MDWKVFAVVLSVLLGGFSQGEYAFAGAGIALAIMGVLLDVTRLP